MLRIALEDTRDAQVSSELCRIRNSVEPGKKMSSVLDTTKTETSKLSSERDNYLEQN